MRRTDDWRFLILGPMLAVTLVAMLPGSAHAAKKHKQPSASAQLSFGVDMAKRGLWSEALFRFQQADRMDLNNAKTLNNLAVAYEAVGRFDDALEYYKKALQASPNSRDLKKNYARFVEFYQGFKPEGPEGPEDGAGDLEMSEDVDNTDSGRA